MPEYQFDSQDKIVQKMSRDGLLEENLATGEQENVSKKKADYTYGALTAAEAAINAAVEIHEYKQYYSSVSNADVELEAEELEESNSTFQSSYKQGDYTSKKESSAENEESFEKYSEQNKQEEHFKKNDKGGERQEGEKNTYKFNRGGNSSSAKTALDDSSPEVDSQKKDDNFLKKWDQKIQRAELESEKRQKTLPTRMRLKFDQKTSLDDDGNIRYEKGLKFKKEKLTQKQYTEIKRNKHLRRKIVGVTAKSAAWNNWSSIRRKDRDEIHESEASASKEVVYYGKRSFRKSARNIKQYTNPYARLERAQDKAAYYRLRRDETEYKHLPKDKKELQKQLQKRKYKKAALENSIKQGEQRIIRHRNFFARAKDAVLKVVKAIKSVFTVISSGLSIFIIVLCIVFGIGILITIAIGFGGQGIMQSTYQAGYDQISDCSAYMQTLETDLKERISKIETEECPGCYEYIYNLGSIGHNSVELMSYLAAKYIEFDLDKCQLELDSLFNEMYTLIIEIREEPREREMRDEYGQIIYGEDGNAVMEIFMAKICYITLEVKPLSEIIENRLDAEQKEQFETYMLSSGGQQVYANCLPEKEWSSLISSKFGERIHPITGERTFHNGLDIAVPTGTVVSSSAAGIVTTSAYSESAGHYIIVTMENGWSMKYMHMDSRAVSAGDVVLKGQIIGKSGNSGNSTGPHLHLEVRDANNKPIDPTFMIPSNSVIVENSRLE